MEKIQLHPSVEILKLGETQIQIRVPDGEHISLDTKSLDLTGFFEMLKQGATIDELLALFNDQQRKSVAHLITSLQDKGYITAISNYFGSSDYLLNMFDYYVQSAIKNGVNGDNLKRKSIFVIGEGIIANTARNTLDKLSLITGERGVADLVVVCSDSSNFEFMLEQNQQAIDEAQNTTFIYRIDSRLVIGPLVYPKESACFNCFTERLKSNTFFINEFQSLISQETAAPIQDDCQMFSGLLQFFIAHHVISAVFQITDSVKPDEITEFGLTSGVTTKSAILKLPRCNTCGRAGQGSIKRAVRDLL